MLAFLKEVSIDLVHRFGDQLTDLAIIFNSKRPEVYMKKYLAELQTRPVWSPSFLTIQDFFRQGSGLMEADKMTQIIYLHTCYTQLLLAKQQEPLTIDRFFPIAETILSDFAQIDYDLVDPQALYQEVHDLAQIEKQFQFLTTEQIAFLESFWKSFSQYGQEQIREKFIQLWKIMPQLYNDFKNMLANQSLSTTAGMYRIAATDTQVAETLTRPFKQLIFVGFNALNNAEGTLFKKWQDQDKALFYFDADAYYFDDPVQEAGYFIRKNIHQWQLKNALGHFPDRLKQRSDKMHVFEAAGFVAQAKLLDAFLTENKENESVAVLLADENLLIPTLQSIPDTAHINITMGFPMNQSPLFGLIDLWLKVQTNYHETQVNSIAHQEVENMLVHPLMKIPLGIKEEVQQKIKAGNHVQVPYALLEPYEQLAIFFKRETACLSLLDQLEQLLKSIFSERRAAHELTLIEASLISTALQELNHLYDAIQQFPALQQADLSFLLNLIRKHLFTIHAAIEGDPLKGVQIMGLLESRNLDFKEIYLLGANDGVLPQKSFGNTFIPDAIRRAYGLPVLENQEALSAYLFYRLLQRTEKLTIIYNSLVDEESSGEVTRFVKQLAFESTLSFPAYKQQQETKGVRLPHPLCIEKTGPVADILDLYLADGSFMISATALTNYVQSPLLFFLKNMARIREPELLIEDFQVNKIGSILHEVMQWFYEELKEENPTITANRIKAHLNRIPNLCLKALSKTFYRDTHFLTADKANSMEQIILQIVADYAHIILNQDIHAAPFKIIELENNKDYVIDFPITVNGEERTVKLQGIIDRIDEKDGKIRIVDYKTGGDELAYTRNVNQLFDATDPKFNKALIQTLFYTYIYEQKSRRTDVEPHLYAIRRLKDEGSLFHSDRQPLIQDKLSSLKVIFQAQLRQTLEEIFNKDIPFQHRPGVILPYNEVYEEFFKQNDVVSDHL